MTALDAGTRYPLASAISLVLLAAWGVLLVTRGAVRRAFAYVAALAAVGLLVAVVAAYVTLPDTARNSYDQLMGRGSADAELHRLVLDGRRLLRAGAGPGRSSPSASSPTWPEMGSRYDAPGLASRLTDPAPTREQDLWKALDEGRDPTDTNRS